MARVSASETTRQRIAALLGGAFEKSDLMQQAVRLIIEETLEAEVGEALGREHYARAEGTAAAYRNGQRLGRLKSAEGVVECAAPQVRGSPG